MSRTTKTTITCDVCGKSVESGHRPENWLGVRLEVWKNNEPFSCGQNILDICQDHPYNKEKKGSFFDSLFSKIIGK